MAKKYPKCPDGGPYRCLQRAWCIQCSPKGSNFHKTGTPGTPPLEFPEKAVTPTQKDPG